MKVMIADEDVVFRDLCVHLLSGWGFEAIPANDIATAHRLLPAPDGPALAIVGAQLADFSGGGDGPFHHLRALAPDRYLYLMAVAPQRQGGHVLAALSAGADDLLPRTIDPDELRLRIAVGRRIVESDDALRRRCIQDGLTGVYSRPTIVHVLQKELARHGREQRPLALALLEMDGHAAITQLYGAAAAADILREGAHRIASVVRPYDWVARDDVARLLVLLPTCDAHTAKEVAGRMRDVLSERRMTCGPHRVAVTASIGLAHVVDPSEASVAGLMQRVEDALHEAVQAGRDRVQAG